MAQIRNCRQCRKIFQFTGGTMLCPVCRKMDEEEFERVRVFLRDYPGANMQEVSENTEVKISKINRWLREERLEVSEDSPVAINCENCGVRIRSGRFCTGCSRDLGREMLKASNELKENVRRSQDKGGSYEKDEFGLYYKHRRPDK